MGDHHPGRPCPGVRRRGGAPPSSSRRSWLLSSRSGCPGSWSSVACDLFCGMALSLLPLTATPTQWLPAPFLQISRLFPRAYSRPGRRLLLTLTAMDESALVGVLVVVALPRRLTSACPPGATQPHANGGRRRGEACRETRA